VSATAPGAGPGTPVGDDGCRHDLGGPRWLVDGTLPVEPAPGTDPAAGRSLDALGRWLGRARWVEHRLFEVVGAWAGDERCADAATLYSVLSRQCAAHAGDLADRLPVLATVDPDELTAAPAGWEELANRLAGAAATIDRLVGLGRVAAPRLTVGYGRWLAEAGPAEAAARQTVRRIFADWQAAWTTLEAAVLEHRAVADHRVLADLQVALTPDLVGPEGFR
jgi:hypothetical protein